jgi:F0F1-type ATP synthase membrane subunit c/vacuolar-type H+-ATPase subunit K
MEPSLRLLRTVRGVMLASIVLYAFIGELAGPPPRSTNSVLFYAIAAVAVAIVGAIFMFRRTMVARSEIALAAKPDDASALNRLRVGFILVFALCEAIAFYGLVLRFLGCSFSQVVPFYLAGFLLLLYFAPRRPANTIG